MSGNLASMGKTARQLKKMSRQERTELRAREREAEAAADRFGEAYQRWAEHRGAHLHEACPLCGDAIRITPCAEAGVFDLDHAAPTCARFAILAGRMALLLGLMRARRAAAVDLLRNVG